MEQVGDCLFSGAGLQLNGAQARCVLFSIPHAWRFDTILME
jgi:hypothetical protein